jgi:hypothetical protein
MTEAVEMTGYGKGGKPKAGFPPFPQPLEIALRFPHSHRTATISHLKTNYTERTPSAVASLPPPSGSFFNEKMLPALVQQDKTGLALSVSLSANHPQVPGNLIHQKSRPTEIDNHEAGKFDPRTAGLAKMASSAHNPALVVLRRNRDLSRLCPRSRCRFLP